MGNILPHRQQLRVPLVVLGRTRKTERLTTEGGLEAGHPRRCGESCVESMESAGGLVRLVELLPAPSLCQPHPQVQPSSDAFPPRPSLSYEFLTIYSTR